MVCEMKPAVRFTGVAQSVHRLHQVSTVPFIAQADTDSLHDRHKDCWGRGPARTGWAGQKGREVVVAEWSKSALPSWARSACRATATLTGLPRSSALATVAVPP